MDLLEETSGKRESRLREENQVLSEQNMATLKMVEQEKADLISAHIKRQEEWQNEKQSELDKLREIHRYCFHVERKSLSARNSNSQREIPFIAQNIIFRMPHCAKSLKCGQFTV